MMKVDADGIFFIDNNSVDRHFELRRIDWTLIEPAGASCEEKVTEASFEFRSQTSRESLSISGKCTGEV